MHNLINIMEVPNLLIVGFIIVIAFYFGRSVRKIKLPSIIGFMILGVLLGPSLGNIIYEELQIKLSFLTEIALSFVALSIGLELNFQTIKKLGVGIIYIILCESFGAFILVTAGIYLLTRDLPMALTFGAIAPASAPAGTVAIIQEYKAKGSLTKALYAVVGFDDGLGIIIFGFAAAVIRFIYMKETGNVSEGILVMALQPLKEIFFSLLSGGILAFIFSLLARKISNPDEILVMVMGFTFIASGICLMLHLSLILTNMIIGIIIVNSQPYALIQKIHDRLPLIMPVLFLLFFTMAGSNLHLNALPALGLIGVVYILLRSAGLIAGSRLGAIMGRVEKKIKNYLGLGILSQAGVAIGLALIVKHDFRGLGKVVETVNGQIVTSGDKLGSLVLTTVTVTCIFFEIIGPILTKIALKKAGEIE